MYVRVKNNRTINKYFGFLVSVEVVTIVALLTFFLYRLPLEMMIAREDITFAFGVMAAAIAAALIIKIKPTLSIAAVYLYALYLLIRFLVMNDREGIVAISMFQYAMPLAFFLMGVHLWRKKYFKIITKFFVIAVAISLLGGLANYFGGWAESVFAINDFDKTTISDIEIKRAGSLAGNSLATGFLAMIGMLLSFARPRWQRYFIPIFIIALLTALSRGAIIMLIVGVLAWIITKRLGQGRTSQTKKPKILQIVVLLISVGAIIIYLTSSELLPLLFQRYTYDMFNFAEESNYMRVSSWLLALDVWLKEPLLGAGFGVLGGSAVKYGISDFAPESMYLKILGEIGLVGLFFYGTATLVTLFRAVSKVRDDSGKDRELAISLFACITAILFGGIFLQNIEYDFFAVLYWFLMGGLAAYGMQPRVAKEIGKA